jgi:hypothetical protein
VVVSDMLDRLPPGLHQEMVDERGLRRCSPTGPGRRAAPAEAVALSWVQSAKGCAAQELPLLVREGARSQGAARLAAVLVWPDMCSTPGPAQELSPSLSGDLSRRPLSTLQPAGTDQALLLRQEVSDKTLRRHGLRARLGVRRALRRAPGVWRASLPTAMPRRAVWRVRSTRSCTMLLRPDPEEHLVPR